MILVTGGTGFVGRRLVARLLEGGEDVRLLSRSGGAVAGAEAAPGDVRDLSSLLQAADGCTAAIHLVGIIRESRESTYREVHVEGTRNVLQACREAGVDRLLHMSALGTRPHARSAYHRTKWEAEELVRASELDATIFRPSVMFGTGNSFLPRMRDLVHNPVVIPVIGDGMRLLQPIWVEDVVSCFVAALANADTVGGTYELGGPETFGFEQLLDLIAEEEAIERPKVHLPAGLVRPVVSLASRIVPRFPVTPDQLTMLLEDNVCDISEMRQTFGIEPAPLRDHLAD